jgi:uncharacterized protein (DUF58 family)
VLQLLQAIARLNQTLASPESAGGPVNLNAVLTRAVQLAKHDHLVVLISDLDGADNETKRLATQLAAHNDVLVAAIYDPLGASLIGAPGMFASDRGRVWDISGSATFTDDFQRAFQRRLDEWRDIFQALRVPVLPITTARPVPEQMPALIGQRYRTA